MDRRSFLLRSLGLTAAATAALVVPGTEAWAELLEPRRRWWQGWGGPKVEQVPFGGWAMIADYGTLVTTQAQIQEHIRAWERSAVVHVRFGSEGWRALKP